MGESIGDRLERVQERIARAAARSGRNPADITLIAVSKKMPAAAIVAAYEAGQRAFGENYIQEFQSKKPQLPELAGAAFHFIGELQRNKTRLACDLFDCIQTVSSVKVARRLNEQTENARDIFIEVKLSGEESKAGIAPEAVGELVAFLSECEQLRLRGLMTMPPWSDDPETARPYFSKLRSLAELHGLDELSMGMSGDLEVAIEEGSTLVRVGTAIFGSMNAA
jgi:pyridoxal phosphate enzyme (YggS family)